MPKKAETQQMAAQYCDNINTTKAEEKGIRMKDNYSNNNPALQGQIVSTEDDQNQDPEDQKDNVEAKYVETEDVGTAVVINDTATDNEEVIMAADRVVTQSSREYEDVISCMVKNEAYGISMPIGNREDEDNLYELVV